MKYTKQYSKKELNTSGIYKIINTINNKCYVGSASKLRARRNNHSLQLRKGIHNNQRLQRSVNKYNFSNFRFEILEACSKDKLIKREQYYVDLLEPDFNIIRTVADNYKTREWASLNKESLREAHADYTTYIWDTKTNKQYVIGNVYNKTHLTLHSFCEEFKLTKESIRTAFNKNKNNYKQFVIYRERKENKQPSIELLNKYYNKHKDFKIRKERISPYTYTLTSPDNKVYTFNRDLKGFCEAHNLDRSSVVKVTKGILSHTKKWTATRQLTLQ